MTTIPLVQKKTRQGGFSLMEMVVALDWHNLTAVNNGNPILTRVSICDRLMLRVNPGGSDQFFGNMDGSGNFPSDEEMDPLFRFVDNTGTIQPNAVTGGGIISLIWTGNWAQKRKGFQTRGNMTVTKFRNDQ